MSHTDLKIRITHTGYHTRLGEYVTNLISISYVGPVCPIYGSTAMTLLSCFYPVCHITHSVAA